MMKKITAFSFVLAFLGVGIYFLSNYYLDAKRQALIENYQPPEEQPMLDTEYDVIVIGGEPEGVAAAVSAARNGSKTLLVEKRENLGGLMTFGMLNYIDIVHGVNNKSAVGGIYNEWHKLVGRGTSFDIELGKAAFLKLVKDEPNLTLVLNTEFDDVIKEDYSQHVIGVNLVNENGHSLVYGKRFIDATQDADFAVMAGAPHFIGGEDINMKDRLMAVTIMLHLKNVDWNGVRKAARDQKFGYGEVTRLNAWGFNDLHFMYEPKEENTRLRGLNIVRVPKKEEIFINALQIFGVNGLDEQEKQAALEKGIRETNHIVDYLRKEFPGFENAEVASYPSELYVRETRHLLAEYYLPMSDVWKNADHWDSIGFGGYPVDVQATSIGDYGYIMSNPVQYAIPFRSLVPLEIENVLVVSRSAGYSSIAAGSARIIPTGMAAGEAGGVAARVSIDHDLTFRQLSQSVDLIMQVRETLSAQDAKVDYFSVNYPYEGEWFDESIQFLIDYGLVSGGYENELFVNDHMNLIAFSNIISNGLLRIDDILYQEYWDKIKRVYSIEGAGNHNVDRDTLAAYLVSSFSDEPVDYDNWDTAFQLNLIDHYIYDLIPENRELIRAEVFYIAEKLLKHLSK
ncbi:FAD-dependent oxidoreductase [Anaerobacillus alkaliphilus]|uniref:FAD-dependent oxidoreductase n=1 Tax=Anaerobacillus alkaliphilus TaxID=1548597 RepID=A0A4Q0VX60_9BACI|nr:FAD-dependent oxidoreductase [Anaerobacillus alkaliphilus]RXJ02922.1 FAD-dependent oxidoreductase [Anaerobacillus alkaliphilus]